MRTFDADGVPHRTRDLCAYDQFHLLRLVLPVLSAAVALDIYAVAIDAEIVAAALSGVASGDITKAFDAAAGAAERQADDGEWQAATKAVALPDMLAIVLAVVDANFSAYLARQQPQFTPAMGRRREFEPVLMPDGESWLFRPCRSDPPMLDMLSLFDGRASLFQVAKANDVLDVEAENESRAMKPKGRP